MLLKHLFAWMRLLAALGKGTLAEKKCWGPCTKRARMLRAANRADRGARWRAMASRVLDKSKRGTLLASAGKFAAAGALVVGAGALGFKWMAERKRKREAELETALARFKSEVEESIKAHQRDVSAQIEALNSQLQQRERAAQHPDPPGQSEANREHSLAIDAYTGYVVAATEKLRSHTANPDTKELSELKTELTNISLLTQCLEKRGWELVNGVCALERGAQTLGVAFNYAKARMDDLGGQVSGLEATLRGQVERDEARADEVKLLQYQVARMMEIVNGLKNVTAQAAKDALEDHGDILESRLQEFIASKLVAITLAATAASEASERADRLAAEALRHRDDVDTRVERLGGSFQRAMSELFDAGTKTGELHARVVLLENAVSALSESTSGAAFGATSEPLVVSFVRALGAVDAADRRAVAQKMARVLFARAGLKANRAEFGSVLYTD